MSHLSFEPKKEEELIDMLSSGIGNFEVLKATEKMSKNNNPMIELLLKCWDANGQQGQIFDYLIISDNKFSQRKIRHFCFCVGLEDKYESGKLDAHDCERRSGNIMIAIQKDKNGQYQDKNIVADYIQRLETTGILDNEHDNIDNDIPF